MVAKHASPIMPPLNVTLRPNKHLIADFEGFDIPKKSARSDFKSHTAGLGKSPPKHAAHIGILFSQALIMMPIEFNQGRRG